MEPYKAIVIHYLKSVLLITYGNFCRPRIMQLRISYKIMVKPPAYYNHFTRNLYKVLSNLGHT